MMIDGTTVKTPTDLKVGVFRITKAERLASGKMAMEIVAVKRRLDLSYALISEGDLKQIMDLLEAKVFHTVTYPDPQGGEEKTITAYVGDMNQVAWQKLKGTRYWADVSVALIEQ